MHTHAATSLKSAATMMRKKKIHEEGEMKRERGLHGDQSGSSGSQG